MTISRGTAAPPVKPTGRVPVTISWLELLEPPARAPLQPPLAGVEIVRALQPPIHFYRYLYDAVGRPWLWTNRCVVDDQTLAATIGASTTDLRVLWVHGVPAGYAELDFAALPDAELAYFGLVPEFIGRGLGRYFLDWAIRHAFHHSARRLAINTCDVDHPRALSTYEAAGFSVYDRTEAFVAMLPGYDLPAHARYKPILPVD